MLAAESPLLNIQHATRWFIEQERLFDRHLQGEPEEIPGSYGKYKPVSYRVVTMNDKLVQYTHYTFAKERTIEYYQYLCNDPGAGEGHGIDNVQIPYIERDLQKNSYLAFIDKQKRKCKVIRIDEFIAYVTKYSTTFPNRRDSQITGKNIRTWAVPTSMLRPIDWQIPKGRSHAGKFKNLDDYS